jgi:hypothetical protein
MPTLSKTFEFFNPWSTKNSHTTQASITMPQMVNGQRPDPVLTLYSNRIEGSGYYKLGSRSHLVAYTIEGAFIGTCMLQYSDTANPSNEGWIDIPESYVRFIGLETSGSAGLSGGFDSAVSHPTKTETRKLVGDYAWLRARLEISRGTLQSIKINF